MSVQMTYHGDEEIRKELRRLMFKTGRITDVLGDIGAALEASTQQRFIDEESPEGVAWKEHSDATKKARGLATSGPRRNRQGKFLGRKKGKSGADILRDKQHLFDSLGHSVFGTRAAVGVNMIYGRIHQLGGQAGRGRAVEIPARPYLGISRSDYVEIRHIIDDHMKGSA